MHIICHLFYCYSFETHNAHCIKLVHARHYQYMVAWCYHVKFILSDNVKLMHKFYIWVQLRTCNLTTALVRFFCLVTGGLLCFCMTDIGLQKCMLMDSALILLLSWPGVPGWQLQTSLIVQVPFTTSLCFSFLCFCSFKLMGSS